MISISIAKSVTNLAYTGTYAFGPFSPDGSDLFDVMSTRSSFDSLRERPGIFGENHVNHRELRAQLYADPWFGSDLPKPWTRVTLYNKLSSGAWGSATSSVYAKELSPSFPWSRVNDWGDTFIRKLSPTQFEYITLQFEFDTFRRLNRLVGANYTIFTCDVPKQGAKLATYYRSSFIMIYRDKRGPYINGTSTIDMLKIVPQAVDLSLAGTQSHDKHPGTLAFPMFPRYFNPKDSSVTPRDVMLKLQWVTEDQYDLPQVKTHGELSIDAIDTLDTNSINMFEFLQGFKRPQDLVPKLKNLSKLKTHAGNYLGVQYGILPTVSDLEKLKEAIMGTAKPYFDSNNYQVLTAGASASSFASTYHVECTNRVKICINPSDPALYTLSEKLRDIGGFPSVNNLWELIPYSFVLDWFINVGDMLESLDARFRMSTLPIMYATSSSKIVVKVDQTESLTAIGVSGDLSITFYDRSVSPNAPSPPLSFEVSNELPNHWLEAGALIVTARK